MSTTTFAVGDKIIVRVGAGFANEGQIGKVTSLEGIWVGVTWDEPKGERIDGFYAKSSLDKYESPKTDISTAIAALVDKTRDEAYEAGKADGKAEGIILSTQDRESVAISIASIESRVAMIKSLLTES